MTEIDGAEGQRVTIESYNANIGEYADKSANNAARTIAYWPGVEFFLDQLQPGQEIFEVGSGSGADALRIESKGFVVQRSDITEAFLALLSEQGHVAERYDALKSPTKEKHSAIFANAVFLHFSPKQFQRAIANTQHSLSDDGLFCIGMKLGDFEGWREKGLSDKRYFKFWGLEALKTTLSDSGFTILNAYITPKRDYTVITAKSSST